MRVTLPAPATSVQRRWTQLAISASCRVSLGIRQSSSVSAASSSRTAAEVSPPPAPVEVASAIRPAR